MQKIRRIVGVPGENSSEWDLAKEFDLEEEIGEELVEQHLPTSDNSHLQATSGPPSDHFTSLIKAALANEGNLGKFHISKYWLQTILAGLEGRGDGLEDILQIAGPDNF